MLCKKTEKLDRMRYATLQDYMTLKDYRALQAGKSIELKEGAALVKMRILIEDKSTTYNKGSDE